MGWWINQSGDPDAPGIKVNNGLGAVLLDVLVVVGSPRASTPWERRLVYWLCCHDSARVGTSGIEIHQMGWAKTETELAAQKRFLVEVIDAALAREGWERLPFAPHEGMLFSVLAQLRAMIESVSSATPDERQPTDWRPDELPPHGACAVHGVFRHETGCIVCNDAPLDTPAAATPHRTPDPRR